MNDNDLETRQIVDQMAVALSALRIITTIRLAGIEPAPGIVSAVIAREVGPGSFRDAVVDAVAGLLADIAAVRSMAGRSQ